MATFNATTGNDNLVGSAGNVNDTFVFQPGTVNAADKVDGRGGTDTIQASGPAGSTIDFRAIGAKFTSIERLAIGQGVTADFDSGQIGGGTGKLPTNLIVAGGGGVIAANGAASSSPPTAARSTSPACNSRAGTARSTR